MTILTFNAAAVPSLAGRDAVFDLLAREPLQGAGEAFTPYQGSPSPVVDRALTPASATGGQSSLDHLTLLALSGGQGTGSDTTGSDLEDDGLVQDWATPG